MLSTKAKSTVLLVVLFSAVISAVIVVIVFLKFRSPQKNSLDGKPQGTTEINVFPLLENPQVLKNYVLFCTLSQLKVGVNVNVDDILVKAGAGCRFKDVANKDQEFFIILGGYRQSTQTSYVAGEGIYNGEFDDEAFNYILASQGFQENKKISVSFTSIDDRQQGGGFYNLNFFGDAVKTFYTPEKLSKFIQTGTVSELPKTTEVESLPVLINLNATVVP